MTKFRNYSARKHMVSFLSYHCYMNLRRAETVLIYYKLFFSEESAFQDIIIERTLKNWPFQVSSSSIGRSE